MSHVSEEVSVQLHTGVPDARTVKKNNLEPVDTSMDKGANRLLHEDRNSRESKKWQGCFNNRRRMRKTSERPRGSNPIR